jgi:predicted dehydrogenase
MAYRVIQVGLGAHGTAWCRHFLPPNVADGLIEVVAAVDVNPAAHKIAQDELGLRPEQCYTDVAKAFDAHPADFCTNVVPSAFHEHVVDLALAHDMHILSEKPIADTLAASLRIADKVTKAGKKMAVTMSHRFDQDKTTLRRELRSESSGPLDYLACRFTVGARKDSYPSIYYGVPHPLMMEMAVHHLDILADLAGAPCETLYAESWNPEWSEFHGDCQGLVTMRFENGVRAVYEAGNSNAIGLNPWMEEYIRAECREATLVLDRRDLRRFGYVPGKSWASAAGDRGEEMPLIQQSKWANTWLVEQFVGWLDGGPALETNVVANLQSVALVAAAIESSRTGAAVKIADVVDAARKSLAA